MADSRSLVGGIPVASISACWLLPSGLIFQLSLMMVVKPLEPCSARVGSASELATPVEGPIARRSTSLGTLPVMMNPPMPALSTPVSTRRRVERLMGCAGGAGGVGVGGAYSSALAKELPSTSPPATSTLPLGVARG